ncbi:IS481-type transposase AsIRS14 (nonfunctional) [Aeromonas salmonicida subsp. pectinolytica 34mel]|uniref:IS481-type transposase AsIRS14 (Nonfunctional) n=1 Tax=Aeromonas salmonicida subsp. pectinolytica 34mel TaxID=1324960 RepID=A0A2D1QFW2_AERSA|nr:IS481-type transposase AsIRS14 (nonfunctional) [Aeromonas salmonicida subsp. pectinolytica 34mel]
MNNLVGLHN